MSRLRLTEEQISLPEPEPVAEPVAEPVEPGAEPVAEPVEPGAEPVAEPVTEPEADRLLEQVQQNRPLLNALEAQISVPAVLEAPIPDSEPETAGESLAGPAVESGETPGRVRLQTFDRLFRRRR